MNPRPYQQQPTLFRPITAVPQDRPRPVEVHLAGCDCPTCPSADVAATPIAAWALSGCAFASAVAFAIDPHGAWHALTGAVAHLMGAR